MDATREVIRDLKKSVWRLLVSSMTKMTLAVATLFVVVATLTAEIGIRSALRDDPVWREEFRKKPNKLSMGMDVFRAVAIVGIEGTYFLTREKPAAPQESEG